MSFATTQDVADRLALTFTDAQEAQCVAILQSVTGLIAAACDKDDEWAAALTPIPTALAAFTVEKAAGAMTAPLGVRSEQEQLGAYSHSISYQDSVTGSIDLSDAEELRVRRIVFGTSSASAKAGSILDDIYDLDDATGS